MSGDVLLNSTMDNLKDTFYAKITFFYAILAANYFFWYEIKIKKVFYKVFKK